MSFIWENSERKIAENLQTIYKIKWNLKGKRSKCIKPNYLMELKLFFF